MRKRWVQKINTSINNNNNNNNNCSIRRKIIGLSLRNDDDELTRIITVCQRRLRQRSHCVCNNRWCSQLMAGFHLV